MLKFSYHSQKSNLIDPAFAYRRLGYSLIPVRSNKVSAVPWKRYQSQHVSYSTFRNWWCRKDIAGIGIVTGEISHLAVLDFDNLQHYLDFKQEQPDLMNTYQVKTRRGFHLYFRIPSTRTTRSMKAEGMDWLYEGRYVVAAPSTIDGIRYQVVQDRHPKMLTAKQLRQIEEFVHARQTPSQKNILTASPDLSNVDLIQHYRNCRHFGRNNALFHTACLARDIGFSSQQAQAHLLDTYTHDKPLSEALTQRQQEGLRTIQSAFTRPRNTNKTYKHSTKPEVGLPNDIRETLSQQGYTAIWRVWETIQQLAPDVPYMTEQALKQLLNHHIGAHSIRRALVTAINGKHLFTRSKNLPKRLSNLCKLDISTKSKKIKVGRKKYYYRIPTIRDFCRILNIDPIHPTDAIPLEDLQSVRTARQALHKRFVQRCPGQFPARWLAKRLGVSVRTINRYNASDSGIHVIPVYIDTPLYWRDINWISPEPLPGTCLVDENQKRYPAIPQLARKLIAAGRKLLYRRRWVNYYCYAESIGFDALYIQGATTS